MLVVAGIVMSVTGIFITWGALSGRLAVMLAAMFSPGMLVDGKGKPVQSSGQLA